MPTSKILAWVRRGLIEPERETGHTYVFSFQDLVTLRTARDLFDADVPPRRVHAALEALRTQLPAGRPLSAVTLSGLGSRVLVQDEDATWEADSGQLLFDLDTAPEPEPPIGRHLQLVRARDPSTVASIDARTADDWYDEALDLESTDSEAAIDAYERAIELDGYHSDAHLNLGRLHHEAGRLDAAEEYYRHSIDTDATNARAHFNLGVVREDRGAPSQAAEAYRCALRADPALAVAHFNLSRLHEQAGRKDEALRHLVAYRKLVEVAGVGAQDTEL